MTSSSRPLAGRILGGPQLASLVESGWGLEDLGGSLPPDDGAMDDGDEGATPAERDDAHAAAQAQQAQQSARLAAQREQMEREAIAADAYARGFEEGRLTGEMAEGVRLRTAVQATEEALREFHDGELRWHGAIEENLCALAVAIARHVVGREVQQDPGLIQDLVRRSLTEFPIDQQLTIRVNPQDLATITGRSVAGGEGPVSANRDLRWVADPRIAPGGCIIEGRDRIVDGRVDTALERIWRRLTYANA